ncbi:MAG: Mut7-C RNAse domain-containing protein [Candidatus Omnitrophica bacterium]|nr:Mut7-C RNAse domain-containing protein [Candidatus Omnitrophota bacterium]
MKLILTKELGRLARWLRILGYDSSFYRQDNSSTLVIVALREQRVIVTRNSRLSRFAGPRVVKIDSDFVEIQIRQVLRTLKLKPDPKNMFTRCVLCNATLKRIGKEEIKDKVPEYVFKTQKDFLQCDQCHRVYWQGTHWGNVRKYLNKLGL